MRDQGQRKQTHERKRGDCSIKISCDIRDWNSKKEKRKRMMEQRLGQTR
jgi:hypothetical protein